MTWQNVRNFFLPIIALAVILSIMPLSAMAVTVTGVSGVEVTCDSNGSISESGGTVTVKAAGSFTTRKTTEITIKNTSGSTATISFNVSTSNIDSGVSTIDDLGGKFSQNLTAGQTVTYKLCSTRFSSDNTGVATLSNFQVTVASTKYDIALSYNTSNGSVTIDGTTAAPGTHQIASGTFKATANSGATFLGWIDPATHKVISTDSSYNIVATTAMNLEAVFAGSNTAWFYCSDKAYLFDNLSSANTHASNASSKTIVLANDGTLAAGNYNISAGVTLLIPYDSANTLCNAAPSMHDDSYTTPSVYRTLTMANGASITVDGAISVSGSQSSKYAYNGMPSGPLGFIQMNSGSTITVNNGASLYVWGYIKGSGNVTVKNGGNVHESFQIADYRGGDATSNIVNKAGTYGVFPFNQYYLQNVEVPLTLYAGAKENGYGSVSVTLAGTQKLSIPFIGTTGSLFAIDSGYVVKDYIEGTGRTNIKVYGGLTVSEITMSMKVALVGSLDIDTSKYALPIPNHFTISTESGSITMNQSIALLPGSELYIKQGTICTLGSGKKIYVYDLDQWVYNDGANGYSGTTNKPYVNIPYVPGGTGTTGRLKDALVQIDGTADVSAGAVYVTSSGANIYSTDAGVVNMASVADSTAYQVITADTAIDSWPEIAMQPAILQDADGTDVATKEQGGSYAYYSSTGRWCTPEHRYDDGVENTPTCTTDGGKTYTCTACGTTKTEAIPANGHTYGTDVTYTWTGYTACEASRTCTVENCGYVDKAAASEITPEVTTAATCAATGLRTHTATFDTDWAQTQTAEETIAIDSTAHAWKNACDTDCDNGCGTTRAATHSYGDWAVTTAPGCETTGVDTKTCTSCGDQQTQTVAATGHSYEVTDSKAATCTEDGYETYTCKNDESHTDTKTLPKTGHSMTHHAAVAPKCTVDGSLEYWNCTACGKNFSDEAGNTALENIVDPSKGHTPAEAVKEKEVAATCGAAGSYESVVYCSVCNAEISRDTVALPATGEHNYATETERKEATCTQDGYVVKACACGATETTTLTQTGHTAVTDAAVAPGCTTTGLTEGSHCSVCGQVIVAQTEVAALGHTDAENDGNHTCDRESCTEIVSTCGDISKDHICDTDSTCTTYSTGSNAHADSNSDKDHICDYCEKEVENGETCADSDTDTDHSCDVCGKENVTEHSYNAVVTAPTCTEAGYTTYTCNCGHTYTADAVAALGHSYNSSVTQEPTCTETGIEIYTCSCGASYTEAVAALGHNMIAVDGKAATCTEDGYTAYTDCSRCDHIEGKETIPAAHTLTQVEAKAATCTEAGWNAHAYCSTCNYTTKVEIPAAGHLSTTTINEKAATCGEAGYTGDTFCNDCQTTTATGETIPATGNHSYGEWVVTKEPTTTETGSKSKTCSVCGDVVTEEIPMVEVVLNPIVNMTGTITPATVTEPDGGWKLGENTFNVKCDKSCVVMYTSLVEGETVYHRLSASKDENEDKKYNFTVHLEEKTQIVVCIKGDVNGDGMIDVADAAIAQAKSLAKPVPLDALRLLCADINGDSATDVADAAIAQALSLSKPVPLPW